MESKQRLVQRLSAEAEAAFAKSRGKVVEEEGLPSLTVSACAGCCKNLLEVTKHVCRCLTPKSGSQRTRRNLRCPRKAHRTPHELFSSPSAELFGLAGLSIRFLLPRMSRSRGGRANTPAKPVQKEADIESTSSLEQRQAYVDLLDISFQSELRQQATPSGQEAGTST